MSDYIVKAMAANQQIRLFAATTKHLSETARNYHQTSDVVTAALSRLLTAGAMMGSMMKGKEDVLTLKIGCAGPIKGLLVTASFSDRKEEQKVCVKGYAYEPNVALPLNKQGKLDVSSALSAGILTVMKDFGMKEPFSGQTELVSGEIAQDLTYYFATSEQTPSSVALGALLDSEDKVKQAGGFIVQLMPFAEEETIVALEEILNHAEPVTTMLERGLTPEGILEELFGKLSVEITETRKTEFFCNCSKDRVERAMISIGKQEIDAILAENKETEVKCHFCNQNYIFTPKELMELKERIETKE